jgi:hypothetical protein
MCSNDCTIYAQHNSTESDWPTMQSGMGQGD